VREITNTLNEKKVTAYTTVQTMCKILVEKGYADFHKEGKAFIYTPKLPKNKLEKAH
jgi:BlaI family penicillinase repressor